MGNLKDRLLCFAKEKTPVAMMLLKSFVLDHVKEGGISISESAMFQHSKIQGLWLSDSFRNGNSCPLSVQGKM